MLLVGVLNSALGGPGGEEDPGPAVGRADVGGAKHEPFRVVPDVGQGAEYGAKCPQRRLGWVVSQTPRAGFHVARGTGGGGEESSDILDDHQAGAEGLDGTGDVQPQARAGVGVEAGPSAGYRDVFGRGNPPSGCKPAARWSSWWW